MSNITLTPDWPHPCGTPLPSSAPIRVGVHQTVSALLDDAR